MSNQIPVRLAMLGMIPGNGHPYSWSAIVNGYDAEEMARCPYPVIPQYLGAQPHDEVRIEDAQVTHIWTDDPKDAEKVARAALIPHVVGEPTEVIDHVDGVVIATDDGEDHARRAAPFIEAGLPVFVDKPLAVSIPELARFVRWRMEGARILSSSGLRYAKEFEPLRDGDWIWLSNTTAKTLERYGIHALEPLFVLLGPGFENVTWSGCGNSCVVTATHQSGALATFSVLPDANGAFGVVNAYGRNGHVQTRTKDTYTAFRRQMLSIVEWLRTGMDPYPFDHTVELMAVLIAARESRANRGAAVPISSVLERVNKESL